MTTRGAPAGRGGRPPSRRLRERLETAKGRRPSSSRWLERQRNDRFVALARAEGYRSRAAYKLLEMDTRFALLQPGRGVLDLGCAPGGWCQVAARRGCDPVVGVDLEPVEAMPAVEFLGGDIRSPETRERVARALGGKAACVLSDMAAPATGQRAIDRLRVADLAEEAADCLPRLLAPGGRFVAKVMRSGAPDPLLAALRRRFRRVRHFKPEASRPESDEIYLVALDYLGPGEE